MPADRREGQLSVSPENTPREPDHDVGTTSAVGVGYTPGYLARKHVSICTEYFFLDTTDRRQNVT
jgi:hypothetical protein